LAARRNRRNSVHIPAIFTGFPEIGCNIAPGNTVLVRTIEIAGITPEWSEFHPFFARISAGIIEICIFQKFLHFPVFLVDNFNLLSTFFHLSLPGEYQT
jgi:hypothetical protein